MVTAATLWDIRRAQRQSHVILEHITQMTAEVLRRLRGLGGGTLHPLLELLKRRLGRLHAMGQTRGIDTYFHNYII
jgi:hypothetical protein